MKDQEQAKAKKDGSDNLWTRPETIKGYRDALGPQKERRIAELEAPPATPEELPCEWYGKAMGEHDWLELPQFGIKRCVKCKLETPYSSHPPVPKTGKYAVLAAFMLACNCQGMLPFKTKEYPTSDSRPETQMLLGIAAGKLLVVPAPEIDPNTFKDWPCPKCGQKPEGIGGEYPCLVCGLPTEHDEEPIEQGNVPDGSY